MDTTSKTGETRKSRVFLIDDHPLVREGLANLINSQRDLVVCGEAEDSGGAMTGIVLSMHDEALYAERALRAGARGYVMKRESTKSVLASIRRVMEGGVYVSERVVNSMARRFSSSPKRIESSPVERLSDRELEIFRLLGQGRTTAQIAEDLHLSLKTVQAYCARAKEKFGVSSLGELLRAAIRWEDATHLK
jgi:DNA-binding NarL/FixJ family response regulator